MGGKGGKREGEKGSCFAEEGDILTPRRETRETQEGKEGKGEGKRGQI